MLRGEAQELTMTQRIAILGTGDAATGDEQTPAPILAAASTGFAPELVDVPGAVFPGNPAAREVAARAYLAAGLAAARTGYAGLYINTVGDYGLAELRAACPLPVTGSGEGAIRSARAQHRRFGIVTIWPPALGFIYARILDDCKATDDCVGVRHLSDDPDLGTLGQPGNFVAQMQACSLTSMAKIRAACDRLLEGQHADVILLGCTCMQPVAGLLEAEGYPVIEPMVAGYRYLERQIGTGH
jgi:allantoin racemase